MVQQQTQQPDIALPGDQDFEDIRDALERNLWAGGNILRGEPPRIPTFEVLPTAAAGYRYRLLAIPGTPDAFYVGRRDDSGTDEFMELGGGGSGGLTLEGIDTTERPHASISETDICTITVDIPTTKHVQIRVPMRKATGNGINAALGLKLNSTIVHAATTVMDGSATTDAGMIIIDLPPRETGYLSAAIAHIVSGSIQSQAVWSDSSAMPAATLTSVVIRALVSNAAATVAVKNVAVYSYAVA